jgi:ferri-bacillibactin esterase
MPNAATVMNGLLASEYFDLPSHCVGDIFRIFVARPAGANPGPYPLLLAADGNAAFPLVTSIQRTLSFGGIIPTAYVVGVGYPTEGGFAQAIQKRNRDYPPTEGNEGARAILGANIAPGGPRFIGFLQDELLPALRTRYPIDAEELTFIGTSLGGLFGIWTLLTAPSTFRRYILASPALFWNDEEIWQWESECARARDDIRASVFLGAGMLETAACTRQAARVMAENGPEHLRDRAKTTIAWCDRYGWPRLAEILPELAAKLQSRHYASLDIQSQCLPDETHLSVPPVVVSRGLRYVFRAQRAEH